jgi:hypothetical protein
VKGKAQSSINPACINLCTDPHIHISSTFFSVVCFPRPPGPQRPKTPQTVGRPSCLTGQPTRPPNRGTSLRNRSGPPQRARHPPSRLLPTVLAPICPACSPRPRIRPQLASISSLWFEKQDVPSRNHVSPAFEVIAYAPPNVSRTRLNIAPKLSQDGPRWHPKMAKITQLTQDDPR